MNYHYITLVWTPEDKPALLFGKRDENYVTRQFGDGAEIREHVSIDHYGPKQLQRWLETNDYSRLPDVVEEHLS